MTDLSNFSLSELHDLQSQVAEQIKSREKEEIAKVQQQILALASSVGMTVEQIMNIKAPKEKRLVAVRYRHPENSSKQWTGRGRQPKWVKEYLGSGKTLESLLVP